MIAFLQGVIAGLEKQNGRHADAAQVTRRRPGAVRRRRVS
jgi:hypothetical protein